MNKIQTAEEFWDYYKKVRLSNAQKPEFKECMIEFAKLHVKAALDAAAENAELGYADGRYELPDYAEEPFNAVVDDLGNANYIDRNSILNAYPDELIK